MIPAVKLHKNTPKELYESLGRFFFTPGCLTPSLFNDDSLFPILEAHGVETGDLADYSVAGCQEPLIMGKDNGNTTNSWLNLGKILELCISGGVSTVTGKKLGKTDEENGCHSKLEVLQNIRQIFYQNVDEYADNQLAIGSVVYPNNISVVGGKGVNLRSFHKFYNIYNTELFGEIVRLQVLYHEQDPNGETGEVHSRGCMDLIRKIKMPWGGTATYGNFEGMDIIHEDDAWSRYRIEAEGRDQYLIEDVSGDEVFHLKK